MRKFRPAKHLHHLESSYTMLHHLTWEWSGLNQIDESYMATIVAPWCLTICFLLVTLELTMLRIISSPQVPKSEIRQHRNLQTISSVRDSFNFPGSNFWTRNSEIQLAKKNLFKTFCQNFKFLKDPDHSFSYFFVFSQLLLIVRRMLWNFVQVLGFERTTDLCCWKWPFYQLSQNHMAHHFKRDYWRLGWISPDQQFE